MAAVVLDREANLIRWTETQSPTRAAPGPSDVGLPLDALARGGWWRLSVRTTSGSFTGDGSILLYYRREGETEWIAPNEYVAIVLTDATGKASFLAPEQRSPVRSGAIFAALNGASIAGGATAEVMIEAEAAR
jgi:hypothetical protein